MAQWDKRLLPVLPVLPGWCLSSLVHFLHRLFALCLDVVIPGIALANEVAMQSFYLPFPIYAVVPCQPITEHACSPWLFSFSLFALFVRLPSVLRECTVIPMIISDIIYSVSNSPLVNLQIVLQSICIAFFPSSPISPVIHVDRYPPYSTWPKPIVAFFLSNTSPFVEIAALCRCGTRQSIRHLEAGRRHDSTLKGVWTRKERERECILAYWQSSIAYLLNTLYTWRRILSSLCFLLWFCCMWAQSTVWARESP